MSVKTALQLINRELGDEEKVNMTVRRLLQLHGLNKMALMLVILGLQ